MTAPVVIDNLEFAASAGTLRGTIAAANLRRVPDLIDVSGNAISYSLVGCVSAEGKPLLALTISGELHLKCQRCLDELIYKLNIDTTLEIAAPHTTETVDEYEDRDQIPAQPAMDVLTLVEDEILLSLPFSPRHEIGECDLNQSLGSL